MDEGAEEMTESEITVLDMIERTRRTAEFQYNTICEQDAQSLFEAHTETPHILDVFLMFISKYSFEHIGKKFAMDSKSVEKEIFWWLNFCDGCLYQIKHKKQSDVEHESRLKAEREAILKRAKWESEERVRQEFQELRLEKSKWTRLRRQETKRIEAMSKHLDKLDAIISNLKVAK